jgi:hypothetical protein
MLTLSCPEPAGASPELRVRDIFSEAVGSVLSRGDAEKAISEVDSTGNGSDAHPLCGRATASRPDCTPFVASGTRIKRA